MNISLIVPQKETNGNVAGAQVVDFYVVSYITNDTPLIMA
jgi:hypothetical protein